MKPFPHAAAILRFLVAVSLTLLAFPLPVIGLMTAYVFTRAMDLRDSFRGLIGRRPR